MAKGMSPQKAAEIFPGSHQSKLKTLRVRAGLSQRALVAKTGLSTRTIRAYEQGERRIEGAQISVLCSLAIALDCTIADLLEDEILVGKYRQCR